MFESIIYAFALLFSICGMFFLTLLLFEKFFVFKKSNRYFTLVPGFPGDEDLPTTVFSAFLRSNFFTFSKNTEVLVLDFGLSEAEKKNCFDAVEGHANIIFCRNDEIQALIVEREKEK